MATIKVGMADLNICKAPDMITTLGLGSCIGIAVYDPVTKVGGLAHIMLPDSKQMRNNSNKAKLNQLGIPLLAEDTGLNYGRTVELYPATGEFYIKAVGKPLKII